MKIKDWLKQRFSLGPIDEVLRHRVTKTKFYYGDGATLLFLLMILVVTGAFLALGYSPSPAGAYESVVAITHKQRLGWFIRALHYWSGGTMILVMIHHLLRHLLLGGYLPPREGTWLIGTGLFVLVITTSFIGYTLRWDERALYAIRVALNMFYRVPALGEDLVRFVQGGESIGAPTLSRLYAVHVIFIPLLLLAFVGYHVYLVVIHGVTTLAEQKHHIETAEQQISLRERLKESEHAGEDFYPHTAARSGIFTIFVFGAVLALTLIAGPQELYPKANLASDPIPREEWWFHWYSALVAYLPPPITSPFYVAFPLGILAILIALPFVDKGHNRGIRRRPLAVITVGATVIALLALTQLRVKSPWMAWPTESLPQMPANVRLSPSAMMGRTLFSEHGCMTCHSVGGNGSQFGPNLTALRARLSRDELTRFIQSPPPGTAMPAYGSRMTDDELGKVVDFVLAIQTFPRKI